MLTVSTDQPEEIRDNRHHHGLQAIMLSDVDLTVTDAFGLRNQGTHSGPPSGADALPVPTTLLIDRDGTVLWVEHSDNYQRRSGPETVLAAIERYLD